MLVVFTYYDRILLFPQLITKTVSESGYPTNLKEFLVFFHVCQFQAPTFNLLDDYICDFRWFPVPKKFNNKCSNKSEPWITLAR